MPAHTASGGTTSTDSKRSGLLAAAAAAAEQHIGDAWPAHQPLYLDYQREYRQAFMDIMNDTSLTGLNCFQGVPSEPIYGLASESKKGAILVVLDIRKIEDKNVVT